MAPHSEQPEDLEHLAEQPQPSLFAGVFAFLRENRNWWLVPILIVIGVFSLLVVLASSGAAPFIYTLF